MATELAEKAKEAINDDDFKLAVDLYSKALELDSTNADYFADRAQANIKLNNFTEAVADANKAIELASSIPKAYLRKGTACMKLEEYHTAKKALEIGASLAQDDSRFTKLIKECDLRIAEEYYDRRKSLAPTVPSSATPASVGSCQKETISSGKPKYRREYYQKPEEVVLTIFAKGIPTENVTVDFGEQILSVTIDVPGEDTYHLQPRLFGKVFGSQRPSYPSSKSKRKDWDKLEAEVKKEERDEKLDGDAALNKFFRDIYQDADEDMRRAMSKSFVRCQTSNLLCTI